MRITRRIPRKASETGFSRYPQVVGASFAKKILYTVRYFSVTEDQGLGLVNRVIEREQLHKGTSKNLNGTCLLGEET